MTEGRAGAADEAALPRPGAGRANADDSRL